MSEQPNKPQQEFTEPALFYRLEMSAPDPDAPNEMAKLQIGLDGDTPVLQMWPRSEAQAKKGPIKARMNTTAFGNHLAALLEKIADSEPNTKGVLANEANRREQGVQVRKVVTNIMVGKRNDGVMVIGLFDAMDDTRPRILFPFLGADWVKPASINGTPITEAEQSCQTARFYADFFRRMVYDSALKETTKERKARMDAIRERREAREASFQNGTYVKRDRAQDEMLID